MLVLKDPYTERSCWQRRVVETKTVPGGRRYNECCIHSWYTSDHGSDGMTGSEFINGWVYHDAPTRLFVSVDDIWDLTVTIAHYPEVDTILIKNIVGHDWLRKQKVNMDMIMWDTSRRKKGKPTVFGGYALMWDMEDVIHGLYGDDIGVDIYSPKALRRLKKLHTSQLLSQLQTAMPALSSRLGKDDIYEITKHMTPTWFKPI